ncbi:hypothetical protein HYFRA_00007911 [Hymenoscyphus fraxineus]|uniref:C2H2-type domain-containing protein n=1 Tax=Hymenoscyphus fraxineus TaxID=746836 RepID=A0A9N9KS69_9HELO|nr:hypothetical protein HYFRA_00007911 [Hymenoscyphus fraxineus]
MDPEESTVPGVSGLRENLAAPATVSTSIASASGADLEPSQNISLKRGRVDPSSIFTTNAGLGTSLSPSPKSPRFKGAFSPGIHPLPLTGAAALADAQRERQKSPNLRPGAVSENPNHKVLSSLLAAGASNMSKPQDGPAPVANMGEGTSATSNPVSLPSPMQFDDTSQTSPASITSIASMGSTGRNATAGSTIVASPASMTSAIEAENRDTRAQNGALLQAPSDAQSSNRALSFPGNLLGRIDSSRIPPRGMSLPMPGQGQHLAPRSPSQKKHKCQYCATEFTRHHNLKSHLLTHSQEKPFVCQTCNMRFRRLHDLKRHMKLHTGERPHVCPKCDRKFARGDALARHSKGQGGCAGRRASMGSFGGDDDFEGSNGGDGDEGMDGVMYTNGTPQNEADMTEEERRRFSLPSIKAQHVGSNSGSADNYESQSRTPSTYPPAGPRLGQNQGGLYPPIAERNGSSSSNSPQNMQNSMSGRHSPNTSITSLNTGGSSMFSQSGMTESPKPLSPSGMHGHQLGHDVSMMNRQRSPSLTTQFQQQQFGRRQSGRNSPPGVSLPSPRNSHTSKLPALSSLAPPDQRYTLSSQTPSQLGSPNVPQHAQQAQQSSGSTSGMPTFLPQGSSSSRGTNSSSNHQASGSVDSNPNLFANEGNAFAYIQQLEDKAKQLTETIHSMEEHAKMKDDKIERLSEEVFSLRNQLAGQSQSQHQNAPS